MLCYFNFCLSEKFFVYPSILNDNLAVAPFCFFFFFNLEYLFSSLALESVWLYFPKYNFGPFVSSFDIMHKLAGFIFFQKPHIFLSCVIFLHAILMEKAMAPHSSTLAWKIPWTEEPGRPQSMGSLRVRHD